MKKEWVEKKEQERKVRIKELTKQIMDALTSLEDFTDKERDMFVERFYEMKNIGMSDAHMYMPHIKGKFKYRDDLYNKIMDILKELPFDQLIMTERYSYENYLDSEHKHFTGDIIITDPCYIAKENEWPDYLDDAYDNEDHPLRTFIERGTIYGDWSCTTFDTVNSWKPIGNFCADAGWVGVFDLSEVLAYNPNFNYHIERPWTTTLIKNFDGTVWFEVDEHYDEDYGYEYSVHVIGKGVNTETGEPIEFRTTQTGL